MTPLRKNSLNALNLAKMGTGKIANWNDSHMHSKFSRIFYTVWIWGDRNSILNIKNGNFSIEICFYIFGTEICILNMQIFILSWWVLCIRAFTCFSLKSKFFFFLFSFHYFDYLQFLYFCTVQYYFLTIWRIE